MVLVGYARVSSIGQNLEIQCEKLKHCEKIYKEKKSSSESKRSKLEACLEYVREGDTLVVTKLDRLARSTYELCKIADELSRKGVQLQVIDQNINTGSSSGRLLFHTLASIAQFETEIRAERQMDGINKAKERGVKFGRKKKLDINKINLLKSKRNDGVLIKTIMKDFSLSKSSVYRYLKK